MIQETLQIDLIQLRNRKMKKARVVSERLGLCQRSGVPQFTRRTAPKYS